MRFWLNFVFYENAFTEEEKQKILQTEVVNKDNPGYAMNGGNDTEDYIFLLSIKEVEDCLPYESDRRCVGTTYAKNDGLIEDEDYAGWWLRSPGFNTSYAAYVRKNGSTFANGHYVNDGDGGVRPAMWVKPNWAVLYREKMEERDSNRFFFPSSRNERVKNVL